MAGTSQRADLRPARCDVPAMLADLERDFAPGRIQSRYGSGDLVLDCDASMLHIALRNLLANADRHCAEGGTVTVSVRAQDDKLHIEVANPGQRILAEDQERLFQKYYRGQNALRHPGAGLGLYLVKAIAERLGGTVVLAGAGGDEPVCFRLSLPQRAAG